MSDAKADTIAKLLAKAESKGITPEEAALFSAKAEELMIKYGIDQAIIDARKIASGGKAEAIVREHIKYEGSYGRAYVDMAFAIINGFGTMRCYYSVMTSHQRFTIVGFESDVAQAKTLLTSLQLQCLTAMSVWWKEFDDKAWMTAMEKFKAKRQFIMSFGWGAGERISRARNVAVKEAGTGTELVLVDRLAQVNADMADMNLRPSRGLEGSHAGSAEGRAAGLNANTGGHAVGGGRAGITS